MGRGTPSADQTGEESFMYTYEYERVYVEGFIRVRIETHQEVITRRAKDGWRYAGYIPVAQNSEGRIMELDLIFEKEL